MEHTESVTVPRVSFETSPDQYQHWQLTIDGAVATLAMDVKEDAGLRPQDYKLKLNSYDLSVDIELADALQRIRFEHPEVHVVVLTSLKPRIFCAGANIFMLGTSSHGFKVNFCKFTNETRLGMEDLSASSGVKFIAALNGICAGGGYELALACDEIYLVDDGAASVALPETPLLGVLPGTGGLTRVVDKRKVRRDLADVFSTLTEGVRGKRAVEWRLVDARRADQPVQGGGGRRAPRSWPRCRIGRRRAPASRCGRSTPAIDGDTIQYTFVRCQLDRERRLCDLTIAAPDAPQPATPEEFLAAGDRRLGAARLPRAGRCAAAAAAERAGNRHHSAARRPATPQAVLAVDAALARAPGALAGARDHRPDPPHA